MSPPVPRQSGASARAGDPSRARIAYFSMEIALESALPTYSGGLGVLAGDTLRAAADLELPIVAVSLVHRAGYFRQRLDAVGVQREEDDPWRPEERCEELPARVRVVLEGRELLLRAWRYPVRGRSGEVVPVYLLDADLPSNESEHRRLTDHLYGGDDRYRLCQEAILGIGGIELLAALGHDAIALHHMNEGHSSLLALRLLELEGDGAQALEAVRERCAFTTHTPVPAGHDRFSFELVRAVLGPERAERLRASGCCLEGDLNMTHMGLATARWVNGVAMRHGQVSRGMFPGYPIASITNGVHAESWVAPPFAELFDRHFPDWRDQNDNLRYAVALPLHEIEAAHRRCKAALLGEVERRSGRRLPAEALTLGFARRATGYKRADLLLSDTEALAALARIGPVQVVYAGKAHPRDGPGKAMIRRVLAGAEALRGRVEVVYLEGYDMELARLLCAGADLWVNTPQKPQEASGTSGMKAALNGVPSLSTLDGWWIEGHVEGVTGWAIGDTWEPEPDAARELALLHLALRGIAETFHGRREAWTRIQRHAIALNGSFFNAQRMVEQYVRGAWRAALGLHPLARGLR